jgi:hypothetical protein
MGNNLDLDFLFNPTQPFNDWYHGYVDAYAFMYEEMFGLGGPITQEFLDTHPDYAAGFKAGREAYSKADEAMKKRSPGG